MTGKMVLAISSLVFVFAVTGTMTAFAAAVPAKEPEPFLGALPWITGPLWGAFGYAINRIKSKDLDFSPQLFLATTLIGLVIGSVAQFVELSADQTGELAFEAVLTIVFSKIVGLKVGAKKK